jgi:hypothetical protein
LSSRKTSTEINFSGRDANRRGLGPAGDGVSAGFFIHPLVAIDSETEAVLGLLDAPTWTRGAIKKLLDVHRRRVLLEGGFGRGVVVLLQVGLEPDQRLVVTDFEAVGTEAVGTEAVGFLERSVGLDHAVLRIDR